MDIGFVGVGRMGSAMIARLIAGGHQVKIFGRDVRKMAPTASLGAIVAPDLAALCDGRSLVITMLPDDAALEQVTAGIGGLIASLPAGAIHMVSGTHAAGLIDRLAQAHDAAGQQLVSCTVLGRPDRAANGTLGLIASGPASAIDSIRGVLALLGQTLFEPGEDPLSGAVVKIANNFVLGCAIEAIGEGMALVRRYGVDPALFQEVLTSGLFDCVAYRAYGDVIAKEDWGRVGATATIGLKDARLAIEAAEKVAVPLPSGNVWRDHLVSAIGKGEASLDWSVMAREQFRRSGLEE